MLPLFSFSIIILYELASCVSRVVGGKKCGIVLLIMNCMEMYFVMTNCIQSVFGAF